MSSRVEVRDHWGIESGCYLSTTMGRSAVTRDANERVSYLRRIGGGHTCLKM